MQIQTKFNIQHVTIYTHIVGTLPKLRPSTVSINVFIDILILNYSRKVHEILQFV